MSDFKLSYAKTMRTEGASNWSPEDGGNIVVAGRCTVPTYAGIAPKFNRGWKGFDYVLQAISNMALMPKYDSQAYWDWKKKLDKTLAGSPALQSLVLAFYQTNYWNANRLGEIESQDAADWCFDHIVNAGGRGARWAQLAAKVTPDGDIGPATIAAVNAMPPAKFLSRVEDIAGKYRLDVAHDHPSQIQWLKSWLERDGQPPEIIAMVLAAAKDGRLDDKEVAQLDAAMDSAG